MPSAFDSLVPLSAAAVSTAVIMYPLDVLRALQMSGTSFSGFVSAHGVQGMFKQGVVAEIGRASLMRVSKFFFFPKCTDMLYGKKPSECSAVEKAGAGFLASMPEILVISPAEVAKIGLQLDTKNEFKNSTSQFIRHTYGQRGLAGIYSGWAGMQLRQSTWTAAYFSTLSTWRQKVEQAGLPAPTLLGGFCAGVTGVIFNCPWDVCRTVVQKRVFAEPERRAYGVGVGSIVEHMACARDIISNGGIRAIYAGFPTKCMHLGGSGALMAYFIPVFRDLLGIEYDM